MSAISGTTTGTPSMSAWNCISQALAVAPPSAAQLLEADAERGVLRADRVDRLVGDGLQRGAGDVRAAEPRVSPTIVPRA